MTEASRLAVAPEYRALASELRARLERDFALRERAATRGAVIGIAGESGSGKSVTAVNLAQELRDAGYPVHVLHQDDYFVRPPRTNHEHRVRDLTTVGPHEVRLDLLQAHIAAFRARDHDVEAPLVDYPANRFVTQRHDFGAGGVLLVEGTYVLTLDDLDARIFLAATHADTRERRRARARDLDEPIIDRILDIEHAIIARQRAVADLVIGRDFAIA